MNYTIKFEVPGSLQRTKLLSLTFFRKISRNKNCYQMQLRIFVPAKIFAIILLVALP